MYEWVFARSYPLLLLSSKKQLLLQQYVAAKFARGVVSTRRYDKAIRI